ncbi:uncharacterized protein LOC135166264 isoform X2 [Diachasmimorpha longicaudata]
MECRCEVAVNLVNNFRYCKRKISRLRYPKSLYDSLEPVKMDAVRDCIECINFHWIAMVGAGMYAHIRQICVIGLCFEHENLVPFQPTHASLIFTFSVLSLLAEFKPWPSSLKEPPVLLLYLYEMLVAAFVTNLSTRIVWMPLISSLWCLTQESSKFLYWANSKAGLDSYSHLTNVAGYLIKEDAVTHMSVCMSILSFVWMLDATESLDVILDCWAK